MFVRPMCFVVSSLVLASAMFAEDKPVSPKDGEQVYLEMTGEVAKEYAVRCGGSQAKVANVKGLSIKVLATVERCLPDGNYRIEHQRAIEFDKQKPRMITLTATVKPTQIKTKTTPANTAVYASPDDEKKGRKPFITKKDTSDFNIVLSDLRHAKIRTWEMLDEVAEDVATPPIDVGDFGIQNELNH